MKQLLAIAIASLLAVSVAQAQDKKPAEKTKTPQQQKMADCAKESKGKKGDEHKAFMKSCMSGGGAPAADAKPADQKNKMGYCNKEAGEKKLKGDDRKKFMSDCLKK